MLTDLCQECSPQDPPYGKGVISNLFIGKLFRDTSKSSDTVQRTLVRRRISIHLRLIEQLVEKTTAAAWLRMAKWKSSRRKERIMKGSRWVLSEKNRADRAFKLLEGGG